MQNIHKRALEKDNRALTLELHFLMRWNKQQNKTYAESVERLYVWIKAALRM